MWILPRSVWRVLLIWHSNIVRRDMRKVLKTAPMFDDVYLEGWDFDGADVLN